MSKYEEADLILKLYELRRESTLRHARDWVFREFHPESAAEVNHVMASDRGAHLRMVMGYWDMASSLVRHGAISLDFFNDANGEQYVVFCKLEPFLHELREVYGPQFLLNLECLIDSTVGGRDRSVNMRERMKTMRTTALAAAASAAQAS